MYQFGTIFVFLATLLLAFQNCEPYHEAGDFESTGFSDLGPGSVATSIEAYSVTLMPLLQQNCASCHGKAQQPAFIAGDATTSHNALITFGLVNLTNPSASRIVQKVQAGHQGFSSSLALALEGEISNWADALLASGEPSPLPEPVGLEPTFQSIHQLVLLPKCAGCHSPTGTRPREDYSTYEASINTGKIVPGNAAGSEMYKECTSGAMPLGTDRLTEEELAALRQWIDEGALDN